MEIGPYRAGSHCCRKRYEREPARARDLAERLRPPLALLRDEFELRDAVLRERDADDVVRRRDVLRRAVERCDAGISALATAFVSVGISRSR